MHKYICIYPNTEHTVATQCSTLQHTATHICARDFPVEVNKVTQITSFENFHELTTLTSTQYTATHCNTLQHTTTHYNTLQRTATHCNTLQHTATHCNTLQHTATHIHMRDSPAGFPEVTQVIRKHTATSWEHTATYHNTVQIAATHCSTLQLTATWR